MIDLFKYINCDRVRIMDTDQNVFEGDVVAVFDKGETYDNEDSIGIDTGEAIVEFLQSEITSIEVLE